MLISNLNLWYTVKESQPLDDHQRLQNLEQSLPIYIKVSSLQSVWLWLMWVPPVFINYIIILGFCIPICAVYNKLNIFISTGSFNVLYNPEMFCDIPRGNSQSVSQSVSMYVCIYVFMYVCVYVRMYVYLYMCLYVRTYV